MSLKRQVLVRRTVVCEACGAQVGLNDEECVYCGSQFEPLEKDPSRLPSAKRSQYAAKDAVLLKYHIDKFADLDDFYPDNVDDLIASLRILRDHQYQFRDYILDLFMLIGHFRSICMEDSQDKRQTYLDVYKRLEAIYASLTT